MVLTYTVTVSVVDLDTLLATPKPSSPTRAEDTSGHTTPSPTTDSGTGRTVTDAGNGYVDMVTIKRAFPIAGVYTFNDVALQGVFGRTYGLRFTVGETQIADLDVSGLTVENCPTGSEYAVMGSALCKPCPDLAVCDGSPTLTTQPGAWRAESGSLSFYSCRPPNGFDACAGENKCEVGHTGPRCAVCEPGYGRNGDSCSKCIASAWNWVILTILCLVLLLMAYLLIQSSMYSTMNEKKLSGLVKMFLSHLQLMATAGLTMAAIPPFLREMYQGQQAFSSLNPNLAFVTCEVAPTFYELWQILSVLPWALIVFFAVESAIRLALRESTQVEVEAKIKREKQLLELLGEDQAVGELGYQEALFRAYEYERSRVRTELLTGESSANFYAVGPDLLQAADDEQHHRRRRYMSVVTPLGDFGAQPAGFEGNNLSGSGAVSPVRRRRSTAVSTAFDPDFYDPVESLEASVIKGMSSEEEEMGSSDGLESKERSRRQSRATQGSTPALGRTWGGGSGGRSRHPSMVFMQHGGSMSGELVIPVPEVYARKQKKKKKQRRHVARNEDGTEKGRGAEFAEVLAVTVIIILFLLYPTLLEYNGRMIQCEPIDNGQFGVKNVLVADRSIDCDTDQHARFRTIALVQFFAYVICVPVFAVGIVKVMAHATMQGSMDAARKAFFFLTAGLQENRWYWEGLVTLRKAVLVIVLLFVQNTQLRVYIDMWFLVICIIFSEVMKPFLDTQVAFLERISLTAIFVTFNLGLLYDVLDSDSDAYWAVSAFIFIVNLIVILCFVGCILFALFFVILDTLRDLGQDVSEWENREEKSLDDLLAGEDKLTKQCDELRTASNDVHRRLAFMGKVIRMIDSSKHATHARVVLAISAYTEFLTCASVRLTGFGSQRRDLEELFKLERAVLDAWCQAERQSRAKAVKLFKAKHGNAGLWGR
jgi:hypothetical protein